MKHTNKIKTIVFAAIVFSCLKNANAQSYNINTFAGNGDTILGDGSAATAADLSTPTGVAIDAAGNVYIADYHNQRIRKVSPSGIISTFAGNGIQGYSGDGSAATAAELSYPNGVAIDAAGNLYIADRSNNRIRKVNTSGIISTFAGNGAAGYSGDGSSATVAELNNPYGVATDAAGNVYIADYFNNCIRKVNTSGIISTIAGNGIGNGSNIGDGGTATAAELYYPTGVTTDAAGNVYIADVANQRIRKVNTSGVISTIAGNGTAGYSGDGSSATAAELYYPVGVATDAVGNIYIADEDNNRIRKLTVATGVTENNFSNENVAIYPNPANTVINLSFTIQGSTQNAVINVLDIVGKSIMQTEVSNGKTFPINVSSLSAGIYFVKITTDKATQTIKFVKTDK